MHVCTVVILTSVILLLWFYIFFTLRNNLLISSDKSKNLSVDTVETTTIEARTTKRKNKYHVPKFMLDLYENNKEYRRDNATVVKSLIPTHAEPVNQNEIFEEFTDKHILIFELPVNDKDELFIGAELKILTIIDTGIKFVRRTLNLWVHDETKNKYSLLIEKEINYSNNTWLCFDITKSVETIYITGKEEKFYLKLMITIKTYFPYIKNSFKLSLMPDNPDFEHEYPVLMLSYSSRNEEVKSSINNNVTLGLSRLKRGIEDDYEEDTNVIWDEDITKKQSLRKNKKRVLCRRKPLYINFSEIEYDIWIVQPPGYEAYQCQGRCLYPVAEHLNPTKHAIVQALLHSVSPSKVARSCCVPTLLDSISILYVDSYGVLTYRYAYKDMVVKECGCR